MAVVRGQPRLCLDGAHLLTAAAAAAGGVAGVAGGAAGGREALTRWTCKEAEPGNSVQLQGWRP